MSPSMEFEIRPATPQDFEAVRELLLEFAEHDELEPGSIKLDKTAFNRYGFGTEKCFGCDVGIVNGIVVSYTIYSTRFSGILGKPILYLEDIFVSQAYRYHGLGRSLMKTTIDHAKTAECARIEWVVDSNNTPAQIFYESLGADLRKDIIVTRLDIAEA